MHGTNYTLTKEERWLATKAVGVGRKKGLGTSSKGRREKRRKGLGTRRREKRRKGLGTRRRE